MCVCVCVCDHGKLRWGRAEQERKAAPLQRGGSLTGEKAAGKVHLLSSQPL